MLIFISVSYFLNLLMETSVLMLEEPNSLILSTEERLEPHVLESPSQDIKSVIGTTSRKRR